MTKTKEKRDALLYPIFDVLINGFNFLIILFINRELNQNDFSIFTAIVSLASIMFIIGLSIQTMTAKSFDKEKRLTINMKSRLRQVLLLFNLIFLLNGFWLIHYIRSNLIGYLAALFLINMQTLVSYERGKIQGQKKFRHLNINFYIEVAVRITFTLILLPILPTYEVAVIAIGIGMLIAYIDGKKVNRDLTIKVARSKSEKGNWSFVIAGNACLLILTNVAILSVNHQLPEIADIYSLATKFSQLIVAVALSIITILIPYAKDLQYDETKIRKFVLYSTLGILSVGIIIYLGYLLVLPVIARRLIGEQVEALLNIIFRQSIAYLFFSLSQLMVTMEIVLNRKGYIVKLVLITILYTILLNGVALELTRIINLEISIHILMFITLAMKWVKRRKQHEKSTTFILERHTSS